MQVMSWKLGSSAALSYSRRSKIYVAVIVAVELNVAEALLARFLDLDILLVPLLSEGSEC